MYNTIAGTNSNAGNVFANYTPEFSEAQQSGQLDTIYNQGKQDLNQGTAASIAQSQSDAAERLASQGVTRGSLFNKGVTANNNSLYKNKLSALSNLTTNRAAQNIGLMNTANQNQFQVASANQGANQQNMQNLFNKYGLQQSTLDGQQSNLSNLNNDNWFDNTLALANTAAGFFGGRK
jgi:hypothetical protein